jgi:WD40 repeat protein
MRKDPSRRYQAVSELAADIENYLKGNPLLAGPESMTYRAEKFVRRHTVPIVAAAVVLVSLAIGLAVSTVSLLHEQEARRIAVAAEQVAVATQEKEVTQRLKAERLAYASDMSLAQQALVMNDLGRARRLLENHRPQLGNADLRGWEWRYLWQECQSDALDELCRYPESALSVAYSRDGRVLAVAGHGLNRFVDLWQVPDCTRLVTLQPREGRFVAFSPQGGLLAADAGDGGNQIRVWQTGTAQLVRQLDLLGYVMALRFSPDGKRLACLSGDADEVTVWEVERWTVVRRIPGVACNGPHQGSLDFSPDSNALVIGDLNHHLRVVDLSRGDTVFDVPEAHPESITSVAWSPDGSVIASGSGFSGGPIRLWESTSGKPLMALEGHTSWISHVVFSVDSLHLYSASADQTIRIWNIEQQQCVAILRGSSDELWRLALSPDGNTLASSSRDGSVTFWDAHPRPEKEQPRVIRLGRSARPAFTPDGRFLALPRVGTVRLLDLQTMEEIEQIPALGADVSTLTYSPDGVLLAGGSRDGRIRVWSCTERRLLHEVNNASAPVHLLRFRNDGKRLLSVDEKGEAVWRDVLTWQTLRSFMVGSFWSVGVSPDGRCLVVGDTAAMRWLNAETGGLLATANANHRHRLFGVAFSDDGEQVASTAIDGTVAVWDSSSLRPIAAFQGHMQGVHTVAFSPDGRRLATGGTGREAVKLWDLSNHRELMTLRGHGSTFLFAAFSPDGRWLTACGSEGELHLWHTPSWEEIEAEDRRSSNARLP